MSGVTSYADAIREGFHYLLSNHREVFAIGQGLWAPWYVGSSMKDLDKEFGKARVIDTPISELATTGVAIGASLHGYRPIVVYPRMDFMALASDQIVNEAAKWRHMLAGNSPRVTMRGIINRGGEQGAQHSQALHAWYAHVPGLRVVMPATPGDARDLLIAATLCDDPVLYIDDRWLYELTETLDAPHPVDLASQGPVLRRQGTDITLVAAGFSVKLACDAAEALAAKGISAEVVDLRVLNPLDHSVACRSVARTGRLLAIDGGWRTCGLAGEIVAGVAETLPPSAMRARPRRITLPDAPAPTSAALEKIYYPTPDTVVAVASEMVKA
jgi:acetoin:2,6-dichlorophenolindophenol oxidoreductase subunit beta